MADNDLEVTFGARIDGIVEGVEEVKEQLDSVQDHAAQLNLAFGRMSSAVLASFEKIVASIDRATDQLVQAAGQVSAAAAQMAQAGAQFAQGGAQADQAGAQMATAGQDAAAAGAALGEAGAQAVAAGEAFSAAGVEAVGAGEAFAATGQTATAAAARIFQGGDAMAAAGAQAAGASVGVASFGGVSAAAATQISATATASARMGASAFQGGAQAAGAAGTIGRMTGAVGGLRGALTAASRAIVQFAQNLASAAAQAVYAAISNSRLAASATAAANAMHGAGGHAGALGHELLNMAYTWTFVAGMIGLAVKSATDAIDQMGEAGEKTERTAQTLGLTVEQIQTLGATATMTGLQIDALTTAQARLYRNFAQAIGGSKQQAQAFQQLGVNIHQVKDQHDLLTQVWEKFPDISSPIEKAQVAMALFGRAGVQLIPFLNEGAAGLRVIDDLTERYGVTSAAAVEKAAALGEANNENKLAWQGVANVLASSLAPALEATVRGVNAAIASFIASYKAGGAAKSAMDGLAGATKAVITAFTFAAVAIADVARLFLVAVNSAQALGTVIGGVLGAAVGAVIGSVVTLGKVIADVLGGRFAQAARDAAAGMMATSQAIGQNLVGAVKDAAKHGADAGRQFARMFREEADSDKFVKGMWSGAGATGSPFPRPKGDVGDLSGIPGPKAKGGDTAMERLRQQFAEEEAANKTKLADMQADELAFWTRVAAGPRMLTLSAKDQTAVRTNIARLEHDEAMKNIEAEIAAIKAKGSTDIAAVSDALSRQKEAYAERIAQVKEGEESGTIGRKSGTGQIDAILAEEVAAEQRAADQKLAIRTAMDAQIMALSAPTTAAYREAMADEVKATEEAEKEKTAAVLAGAKARKAADLEALKAQQSATRSTVSGLVGVWTTGFAGMMQGTTTARKVFENFVGRIFDDLAAAVQKMVTKWIMGFIYPSSAATAAGQATQTAAVTAGQATQTAVVTTGQATQTAAVVTGNTMRVASTTVAATQSTSISLTAMIAQVGHAAAVAAANTWAAISAIPYVGPFLAPALAMAALAGVVALIASAEGGWGQVPADQLAMIHKDEMVLPAQYATPLRSMLTANLSAGPTGGAAFAAQTAAAQVRNETNNNGGGVNIHYAPTISAGQTNMKAMLESHSADLVRIMRNQTRNGAKFA